jgi:hypothetical protein
MIAQATAAAASTGAVLYGVSCTGRAQCTATGLVTTRTGKNARTLAERWNGTKWTTQPLNKQPGLAIPSGISCTWAKDCMTVGTRASGATLAEHWNGKKWSVLATKKYGLLAAVTCPGSKNCTAAGQTSTGKALV